MHSKRKAPSVSSTIYNKDYYLNVCCGSQEFKKTKGKILHPYLLDFLKDLPITKNMTVLDLGCGRGDIALYLASKAKKVIGVDYSKDAIALAKQAQKQFPAAIRNKTEFKQMNAKKLVFPDNSFDFVMSIDVLEHLYKPEAEEMMAELSRVIKKGGYLYVHTAPNAWLYNYTYPLYIRPVNRLLTKIDQLIKGVTYEPLPDEIRTEDEKRQHVNEPTYPYLRDLFRRHGFEGKIEAKVGFLKEGNGMRTKAYNTLTTLYPLSKMFPLNTAFGFNFVSLQINVYK